MNKKKLEFTKSKNFTLFFTDIAFRYTFLSFLLHKHTTCSKNNVQEFNIRLSLIISDSITN